MQNALCEFSSFKKIAEDKLCEKRARLLLFLRNKNKQHLPPTHTNTTPPSLAPP
jgi:hypothetical protein